MVGRLVVEDEYIINVEYSPPIKSNPSSPLPKIRLSCEDTFPRIEFDPKDSSLRVRDSNPIVRINDECYLLESRQNDSVINLSPINNSNNWKSYNVSEHVSNEDINKKDVGFQSGSFVRNLSASRKSPSSPSLTLNCNIKSGSDSYKTSKFDRGNAEERDQSRNKLCTSSIKSLDNNSVYSQQRVNRYSPIQFIEAKTNATLNKNNRLTKDVQDDRKHIDNVNLLQDSSNKCDNYMNVISGHTDKREVSLSGGSKCTSVSNDSIRNTRLSRRGSASSQLVGEGCNSSKTSVNVALQAPSSEGAVSYACHTTLSPPCAVVKQNINQVLNRTCLSYSNNEVSNHKTKVINDNCSVNLMKENSVKSDINMRPSADVKGTLPLPTVHVFSDDNYLVAKNEFHKPEKKISDVGALFVPVISSHCQTGSGEIFIPAVAPEQIKPSNQYELPMRGNSKRKSRKDKQRDINVNLKSKDDAINSRLGSSKRVISCELSFNDNTVNIDNLNVNSSFEDTIQNTSHSKESKYDQNWNPRNNRYTGSISREKDEVTSVNVESADFSDRSRARALITEVLNDRMVPLSPPVFFDKNNPFKFNQKKVNPPQAGPNASKQNVNILNEENSFVFCSSTGSTFVPKHCGVKNQNISPTPHVRKTSPIFQSTNHQNYTKINNDKNVSPCGSMKLISPEKYNNSYKHSPNNSLKSSNNQNNNNYEKYKRSHLSNKDMNIYCPSNLIDQNNKGSCDNISKKISTLSPKITSSVSQPHKHTQIHHNSSNKSANYLETQKQCSYTPINILTNPKLKSNSSSGMKSLKEKEKDVFRTLNKTPYQERKINQSDKSYDQTGYAELQRWSELCRKVVEPDYGPVNYHDPTSWYSRDFEYNPSDRSSTVVLSPIYSEPTTEVYDALDSSDSEYFYSEDEHGNWCKFIPYGERVVDVYGTAPQPSQTVRDMGHPQNQGTVNITTTEGLEGHGTNSLHDHNHNRNSRGKVSSIPRASKYVVQSPESSSTPTPTGGHVNLAYDGSSMFGYHENFGFDQGYSSEKSVSEERDPGVSDQSRETSSEAETSISLPRLRLAGGEPLSMEGLMQICPFINHATLFDVIVIKNSRGLGLSLTGGIETDAPWAGLVRIKKIYPQTPAWLCGQLQVGDIILDANESFLTGLTSHEALEVLRTTHTEVHIRGCRPPPGTIPEWLGSPTGLPNDIAVVSTSLTTPHSAIHLSPSPSLTNCGEFEIELTKVQGSLGFTLRKQDDSILGHTIRSLVKEPAISDGRLRTGDKILSVNGLDMCGLSHEEAVNCLRTCPQTVTLRLYRDAMQTPVSPVSPTEPEAIKPKMLRHEARAMLTDLAFRKNSPSNSLSLGGPGGSGSAPGTPRRRRLQKTPSPDLKKSNKKNISEDDWENLVRESESPSISPEEHSITPDLHEDSREYVESESYSFHLQSSHSPYLTTNDRSRNYIQKENIDPFHSLPVENTYTDQKDTTSPKLSRPNFLDLSGRQSCPRKSQFTPPHEIDDSFLSPLSPSQYPSVDSVDSAPQLTSTHSDTPNFVHKQQGYQSVNLGALPFNDRLANTTSDHNLSSHSETVTNSGLLKWKGIMFTPQEEEEKQLSEIEESVSTFMPKIITLEMNRGWNTRLGFSIQSRENKTVIVAIYADSVAAKDGRLKIGDQILKVNGNDVSDWNTEDVIDLLRKIRGKISISVLQKPF